MELNIVWGSADGKTELGTFDKALAEAGIHNYNLIKLSSVIPQNATIVKKGTLDQDWNIGDVIATVLAEHSSSEPGETIVAGLSWAIADEGGIFMEQHGRTKDEVRTSMEDCLDDARAVRDWNWHTEDMKLVEHTVNQAGAAIVAAVYNPLHHYSTL